MPTQRVIIEMDEDEQAEAAKLCDSDEFSLFEYILNEFDNHGFPALIRNVSSVEAVTHVESAYVRPFAAERGKGA